MMVKIKLTIEEQPAIKLKTFICLKLPLMALVSASRMSRSICVCKSTALISKMQVFWMIPLVTEQITSLRMNTILDYIKLLVTCFNIWRRYQRSTAVIEPGCQ